ncbi:hypothetical protein GIB67_001789 [Kingdonia uniflora]|uniref:Movement protein binding protein 2C n=1 Tax=Kingdonia uniflora TaxID=39325 RepID=A0A7J7LBT3_9MAGN|nr:hypothetical protein GIB67_001789 [Kingdonia uniflora]
MSLFEEQHFINLDDNGSYGDPKSWLSREDPSSPLPPQSQRPLNSVSSGNVSGFDKVLYKNLVEMVPLVESLMDRRVNVNASFPRRASLVYTKTPSNPKKVTEIKGRKVAQSIPSKKKREFGDSDTNKTASADEFSIFTSGATTMEKDKEELTMLQEQVENLEKKLLEKEELLKSAEASMNQMTTVHSKLDELKRQVEEKDSLIKSAQMQLSDAKIKLADKQAALEKLQWESTTSNKKVQKLQEDLDSTHGEMSTFMLLVEGLTKTDSIEYAEDYDITPYNLNHLPYIDDMDEMGMFEMEEAREAYISAVAAAKESQDEEALEMALKARKRLQSFLLRPQNVKCNGESPHGIPLS